MHAEKHFIKEPTIPRMLVLLLAIAIGTSSLIGCASSPYDEVNASIATEGVSLGMADQDVVSMLDGEGEVAPCVQGYERSYPDLNLVVGFDQESSKVRRITAKAPEQSILGVSPGFSVEEAVEALSQQAFALEEGSKSKYLKDDLRVTLTSFDEVSVAEVTIEVRTIQ